MIRILASLLLALLTAGLVVIGIAGIVATGHRSAGAGGGIAFVLLLALLFGSAVLAVVRCRRPAAAAPPVPVTGVGAGLPGIGLPGTGGLAGRPAVRPGVRYRERCSQFPVTGAILMFLGAAVFSTALVRDGGPNGPGAGAWGAPTLAGALVAVVYILLVLVDLPNGIKIGDGRFTVGAIGVRPAGRLWRRVTGPLEAISAWEVLSPAQARELGLARQAGPPRGRRPRPYLGDLRLFGRRQVLRLRVDPARVQVSFPARILVGYVLVPAAVAGAVWDGVVLIGTRRPVALARALEQALPGRRGAG